MENLFESYPLNFIKIENLSVPELAMYSQFSENQLKHRYEPEPGVFIAESPKVVLRALLAGYVPQSMLVETSHVMGEAYEVLKMALNVTEKDENFRVFTADYEVLKNITGYYMVRGLLAVMRRKPYASMDEICKNATRIAVLEDIVNPTNVGAIIRNAAALGMEGVLLTKDCADPLYRRAARVSMGTVFQIPWTYIEEDGKGSDTKYYVQSLKEAGFQTVAMALDDRSISISSSVLRKADKIAVVLGNEGEGLKKQTIEQSDFVVKIPMYHEVDSLNVAAASAVAFWEFHTAYQSCGSQI